MNEKLSYYSCDLETTTDINDCRVWSWGAAEIYDYTNYTSGTDIDSFIKWCSKSNKILYYQNLKFDGEFIINYLLKNNYKYRSNALKNDENYGSNKKVNLKEKEFTAIISDDGKYYYIEICFAVMNKNKRYVKIYDGLKKIPFSVKKMAKAFHLEIRKGEIDYNKKRPIGYIPTIEENEYQKNDVQIPAQALRIQLEKGLNKMTIGSDALSFYKDLMGNKFRKYFPILSKEEDEFVRRSYKGGFCWVNPKYKGLTVKNGFSYDDNSLYPSRMESCEMPTGLGIHGYGQYQTDKIYNLYIQSLRCCFKLKKEKIPTIQIKNNTKFFKENEYISECLEPVVLTLTSIDLQLFFDHYNVYEIEYIEYYKYRGVKGLFSNYINYWNEIKMNSTGGLRELAKLMLNNLYGKFATNAIVKGKYPVLGENGEVRYKLLEETTKKTIYIPVGTFITAYGRDLCIRTAQECYNNKPINQINFNSEYDIAYCDTDSIHCVGTGIPNIKIHPKKLGYWKHESDFVKAKFLRQKTYIERIKTNASNFDDDDISEMTDYQKEMLYDKNLYDVIKCCGMPENLKHNLHETDVFDRFDINLELWGKLLPKHVNGGIVLVESSFKIK